MSLTLTYNTQRQPVSTRLGSNFNDPAPAIIYHLSDHLGSSIIADKAVELAAEFSGRTKEELIEKYGEDAINEFTEEVINMLDEYEAEIEKNHDAYLADLFDKLQSGEIQASDLTAEEFWEVLKANEGVKIGFGQVNDDGSYEFYARHDKSEHSVGIVHVFYNNF